jgi:hypothetical protein
MFTYSIRKLLTGAYSAILMYDGAILAATLPTRDRNEAARRGARLAQLCKVQP